MRKQDARELPLGFLAWSNKSEEVSISTSFTEGKGYNRSKLMAFTNTYGELGCALPHQPSVKGYIFLKKV